MSDVFLNSRDQGIIFVPPQSEDDPRVPTAEELTAQSELLNRVILDSSRAEGYNSLILSDDVAPLSGEVREVGIPEEVKVLLGGHSPITYSSPYRVTLPEASTDQSETLYLIGFFYEVGADIDSNILYTFQYRDSDGVVNTIAKENTRRIRSGWMVVNTAFPFSREIFTNLLTPQSDSRRFLLTVPDHTPKDGWVLQSSPKIQGYLGGLPVTNESYRIFEDGIQVIPLLSIDRTVDDGTPDFSDVLSIDSWLGPNNIVDNDNNDQVISGGNNILFGVNAGKSLTEGQGNIAVGSGVAKNINSGNGNTFVGHKSGVTSETSVGCVALGWNSDIAVNANNQIAIGSEVVSSVDNTAVIGNTDLASIHNAGDGFCDLGASDHRFKDIYATNGTIQTSTLAEKSAIAPSLGLDFIEDLHPVSFQWKNQEKNDDLTHYGLILEEVEALGIDGITRENGIVYTELIPPLIKAVQQLSERVTELEAKLNG